MVAQEVKHQTTDHKVMSSNPHCELGLFSSSFLHFHASLDQVSVLKQVPGGAASASVIGEVEI